MRTSDHVLAMRIREGAAGYGVYVMLLELLRDSETRRLVYNPANLAFAINEPDIDLVKRVIKDYALFDAEPDGTIGSTWLNAQLADYDAKKAAAVEAGRRGAAKRYGKPIEDKDNPISHPIATLCPPPQGAHGNITNITNEIKSNQSKSKLLGMSWRDMGGQDLFQLARMIEPEIDDVLVQWAEGKQRELTRDRGRDTHNLGLIVDICKEYHLGQAMFSWLCRFTNLAQIGSPEVIRLLKIREDNRRDKFTPKYPAEYLLIKLLEG